MAQYDVFLSHYSGDDARLARPLYDALLAAGLSVWYDGVEIKLGDSIIAKVNEGLARSRYGLILFTENFLSSMTGVRWTEVGSLMMSQKLLPILADLDHAEYVAKFPIARDLRYETLRLTSATGRPTKSELTRISKVVADRATHSTRMDVASRDQLANIVGGLEERLTDAKSEIRLSGNDCMAVIVTEAAFLRRALERGVTIRVMCVDPASPAAAETLVRIDPRYDSVQDFVDAMATVERMLKRFRRDYPKSFDFRYMPVAPAIGFLITDPGTPGSVVKFEIYTPKPWATRPHVVVGSSEIWTAYFLSMWDNYWNMSREVT